MVEDLLMMIYDGDVLVLKCDSFDGDVLRALSTFRFLW